MKQKDSKKRFLREASKKTGNERRAMRRGWVEEELPKEELEGYPEEEDEEDMDQDWEEYDPEDPGKKGRFSRLMDWEGIRSDAKKKSRSFTVSSFMISLIFAGMIGYILYFNLIRIDDINRNPYNTKQEHYAENVIRGSIYSADGRTLARTEVNWDGSEYRVYPYYNVFSHVVGYSSNGKSGAESAYNYDLLSCNATLISQLSKDETEKQKGDSIYLTLDSRLQETAYYALGDYRGAVIAMDPKTGKILAMVSKPDYDPNQITYIWNDLVNDPTKSNLLNRATQGQYAPGSTFKILTTLAYLRSDPDYENFFFDCTGSLTSEDEFTITCYHGSVHGPESLEQAFSHSCNTAYASIGSHLSVEALRNVCESMYFNQDLSLDLPCVRSSFVLKEDQADSQKMTTAIGQGETLVSPLEMAIIVSAIANDGLAMKPYYMDHSESSDGAIIKTTKAKELKRFMTSEEAAKLSQYMQTTVTSGTAAKLSYESYTAAGKTGSAEYERNVEGNKVLSTHSWFVGFSNVEDPDLVVVVIAEDGGAGSETAVPIAKQIFDQFHYGM